MQKSIICIKGSSQTGKTPSIRDVYSLIAPKEEQMQNTQFLQDGYDINCHTKYKGVQVGFYSCGDPGCSQYEEVSKHIQDGCEIVICSCRNWGQTKNDIEKAAREYGFGLIFTSTYKSPTASPDFMRKHFVAALINLIDSCTNLIKNN